MFFWKEDRNKLEYLEEMLRELDVRICNLRGENKGAINTNAHDIDYLKDKVHYLMKKEKANGRFK